MVTFGLKAQTKAADHLVGRVLEAVEAWEAAKGVRRRRRTQRASSSLRIALEGIVGAACISADDGTAGRVYRSMSEATWSKAEPVGFQTAKKALDGLAGAGLLIKIKDGYFRRYGFGSSAGTGKAARWQATPRLRSLISSAGIEAGQAREHFKAPKPRDPIVVRAAKGRMVNGKKAPGAVLSVPVTPKAAQLRAEVEEIDTFLSSHKIQGGNHDGYRRVFNDGDLAGFMFDRGGRLQSIGPKSYQSLHAAERLKMRIDGEPVVEIDIRACQFSMLHALHYPKRELPEDPYNVEGLPRDVVKAWVTVALGKQALPKRWPAEWKARLKHLRIAVADYPMKTVSPTMVKRYPFLNRLAESWSATRLQAFESDIIVESMLRLLREHKAPSLAMHDGIIVRATDEIIACRVLESEFEKRMRVKPRLTVDRSQQ